MQSTPTAFPGSFSGSTVIPQFYQFLSVSSVHHTHYRHISIPQKATKLYLGPLSLSSASFQQKLLPVICDESSRKGNLAKTGKLLTEDDTYWNTEGNLCKPGNPEHPWEAQLVSFKCTWIAENQRHPKISSIKAKEKATTNLSGKLKKKNNSLAWWKTAWQSRNLQQIMTAVAGKIAKKPGKVKNWS